MSVLQGSKIQRPVSVADVRQVLGASSNDVGTLCVNTNINKWARHKPINFPSVGVLSEADFKGSTGDIAQGIFYGLKATTFSDWGGIHDAGYDYVGRPKGGASSPYRLTDFDGYDHYARPNLWGDVAGGETLYYNAGLAFHVDLTYHADYDSETGVDLATFIGENVAGGLGAFYPVLVVDDYAKALYNVGGSVSAAEGYPQTQLGSGGMFALDFDRSEVSQLWQDGVTRRVSVGLVQQIKQAPLVDLTKWTYVGSLTLQNYFLYAVPEATGLTKVFREYRTYVKIAVSIGASATGVTVSFSLAEDIDQAETFSFSTTFNNGGAVANTYTFYPPGQGPALKPAPVFLLTWQQLGVAPSPGSRISGTVRVRVQNGGSAQTFSQAVDVTVPLS